MSDVKSLPPAQVWANLQFNPESALLDVRDRLEFNFVGHPLGAINIPWKQAPDWRPNEHFLEQVRQQWTNQETPIFVLCRSGQRSLEAATALVAAGYKDVTNIEEGFEGQLDAQKHRSNINGWRFHGLPWEQG